MTSQQLSLSDVIHTLHHNSWSATGLESGAITPLSALERGKLLYCPNLKFDIKAVEQHLLTTATVKSGRKNISFRSDSQQLNGFAEHVDKDLLLGLMRRHHQYCQQVIETLLPEYQQVLHTPVNSLRVHPVDNWSQQTSWRKDDSRLHVDAFPSRPSHGQRILRLFTNINPYGEARVWRIGALFPQIVEQFLPQVGRYSPLSSWIQYKIGITKSRRTHYDHLMLGLHDAMKADQIYQSQGEQWEFLFPSGSSWICFSDQTPHAAMAGQFMLEQTWLLNTQDMMSPQYSPLQVLEAKLGRRLL